MPELEALLGPHQLVLAQASEQLGHLQQAGLLTRWLSRFLVRRISTELQESGLAAVAHQLELSCCQIADRDLLTPLREFLDTKIGWLQSTLQKVQTIGQSCDKQARRLAVQDTTSENPNGYELTTPAYLEQYSQDYLSKQGGVRQWGEHLQSLFMETHGSMDIVLETPQAELQEMLCQMVEPTFEAVVKSTTVWEEFKKTFPDAHVRQEMLTQLIRHSTGRVIAEDSVGQSVVWIKTANVPNASLVEPVRALLESLDTKGGHWEVAAHDDIDTISLGQLRGGISLSPLIRRLGIPDNEIGWKALAAQAIDVISALIVPPHPSLRQFRRVLAKALAADLITTKDGHFYLERPQQEPLSLGSDFASVKQALLKRWPDLVFIESTYGRALILDEKRVLGQLETLQHRQDMCAALFDAQAFEECLCQTQIMLPRLRRMRVAALREEHL